MYGQSSRSPPGRFPTQALTGDLPPMKEDLLVDVELKDNLKDNLWQKSWIKIKRDSLKDSASLTLDPETSHPYLIVSDNLTSVEYSDVCQNVPDNPKRFDINVCVLASQGFTSGKHYWEVNVANKTDWRLGVASESVKRKGIFTLIPQNGYWLLWLRNRTELKALSSPSVTLTLQSSLRKIGIYLGYEGGQLSFYNADSMSLIYTFQYEFKDKIYPFFNLGDNQGAVICGYKT
nr:PREDICTED: zinc-binding protein A33-like [Latimeria chalumnae]|eukprot:XP_014352200.1 PREDICTED: zinc-binding protein A33-like [Latimeria chalumnae]